MLTTADLAAREDFTLGGVIVSPSSRTLRGPGGTTDVEPRVMQVLVVLADAAGQVVTRENLFNRCWGGVYVGDDSLNRAVAAVRRAGEAVGGRFEVETIPRTGYRLVVPKGEGRDSEAQPLTDRRGALVAGGAAVVAAAGAGLWWIARPGSDPRFDALMKRGDDAIRGDSTYDNPKMVALYQQAVRLEPGNAKAWGLLAYFRATAVEGAPAAESGRIIQETESATRRALAINRKEPNALTAMFLLQGPMLDLATRDKQLRNILTIDGSNILAMDELMPLLQAAGLTHESWAWNERILKLAPLSLPHLVVRSMKLWILGDVNGSDKVINNVRGLWPLDGFGFLIRLMLFALTDRPRAALAMIDNAPPNIRAQLDFGLWRSAAGALETRSPKAIEAARDACLNVARQMPWMANMAVMILCALDQTDAAFEITDGYLLWRGKIVSASQADGRAVNDPSRRMTQWLFTPPVAVMRADPRFLDLCKELGLVAYWRARGVKPDYMRG